jgi:phosphoribosylanthranilate isomerase
VAFKIKICGITNVADALAAADAGADAIGLNFYEKSPRSVATADARRIVTALAESQAAAVPIGVFVNHSVDEVRRIWRESPLAAVQLHGDEPPEMLAELSFIPIVRALRFGPGGIAKIAQDCAACRVEPYAVLIDALSPGRYGGTGETVSWAGLADHERWLKRPLVLAGGLTPDNVAEAIRIVRPQAVDVASGIESSPGKKDAAKMRDFVAAAQEAFAAL